LLCKGGGAYSKLELPSSPTGSEEGGLFYCNGPTDLIRRSLKPMAKYLMLWELDLARTPVDAKERGAGYQLLMAMVKQDIQKGISKDWGLFVGSNGGYAVAEGTEVEILNMVQQYAPFVIFKTYPIASVSQADEAVKALTG